MPPPTCLECRSPALGSEVKVVTWNFSLMR
uniref:Uncharacterized protein n=1 Tax=Anguilla anguilla TaxID=7936 RepID=A0A0E9RSI2_ANGAN